jgi:hypothetical protein
MDGRPPAVLPSDEADLDVPAGKLSNVPAWTWCYGCMNTAAAIIMGYHDRHGYPNMYAGNAGQEAAAGTAAKLCPQNNETAWPDRLGDPTFGESPLSASHLGIDGRATRGHVDDYWVGSESGREDPYMTGGWLPHPVDDCLGDFMWTSRYDKYNVDGATQVVLASLGDPVVDFDDWEPDLRDGGHGMKVYAQSRGYDVDTVFNQLILPTPAGHHNIWGYDWDDYKADIDAGNPVLLLCSNHSFVGFGYDSSENAYIRSTWDNGQHKMRWGGQYGGMIHWAVTVIRLNAPRPETFPDLLCKTSCDAGYKGDGTYGNLADQTAQRPVKPGNSLLFEFILQNDATFPDAITVRGTAGDSPVVVGKWQVQYFDGSVSGADITAAVTAGAGWPVDLPAAGSRNFVARVTPTVNAAEGDSYTLNIRATSGGNGLRQDAWQCIATRRSGGVEPTTTPSPVTNLKAHRKTGSTTAKITFSRCPEDNYACTGYKLYRQCLNPPGALTEIATIPAAVAASYTYTDKPAGATTPYDYSVRSVNGSKVSDPVTTALLDTTVTPAAPSGLAAVRRSADTTQANVSWNKSASDPNAVSHYGVYRRCTTDAPDWELLGTVPRQGTGTTYNFGDGGLLESKAYEYGVRAYNGTKQSALPTCVLQDAVYDPNVTPDPPADLIAARNSTTTMTKAQITIKRSPDDDSGCTDYVLLRRTIPPPYGTWQERATIPATGAAEYSYTDTGLAGNRNYQYAAVAMNGDTRQSPAEMTTLTNPLTKPKPPADVTIADYAGAAGEVEVTISRSLSDPRGVTDYYVYWKQLDPELSWNLLGSFNSDGSATYGFIFGPLSPGGRYRLAVVALNNDKVSTRLEKEFTVAGGAAAALARATATQTALGAEVIVTLSAEATVSAEIVNLAGRPVRRLCADRACEQGSTTLLWDRRSDAGTRVPTGQYLVRITARTAGGSQAQALAPLALR